jgi:hypothetical protein
MKRVSGRQDARASESESGVALIMALLALLLLTAVGLTLATSTSTEVQVAANYRWSLQALYNAEAGMEVAKNVLMGADWNVHPSARGGSWNPSSFTPPLTSLPSLSVVEPARASAQNRDFEMGRCDVIGNGMGYGVIMPDLTNTTTPNAPLVNVSTYPATGGQPLNGAFTLWYRKPHTFQTSGTVKDFDQAESNSLAGLGVVVVVSEGVAPYHAASSGDKNTSAFMGGVHAVQIVEATLYGPPTIPVCEADLNSQAGGGAGGAGVDPCSQAAKSFSADSMGVTVGAGAAGKTLTRHSY